MPRSAPLEALAPHTSRRRRLEPRLGGTGLLRNREALFFCFLVLLSSARKVPSTPYLWSRVTSDLPNPPAFPPQVNSVVTLRGPWSDFLSV